MCVWLDRGFLVRVCVFVCVLVCTTHYCGISNEDEEHNKKRDVRGVRVLRDVVVLANRYS